MASRKDELEQTVVPDVEWWDAVLLGAAGYEGVKPEDEFTSNEITRLIQHPVTFEPPGEDDNVPLPVYLTEKERCVGAVDQFWGGRQSCSFLLCLPLGWLGAFDLAGKKCASSDESRRKWKSRRRSSWA